LNSRAIFKHQTNKKTSRKQESQSPELIFCHKDTQWTAFLFVIGIRPALKKDYQRRKVRLEKTFQTNKIISTK